jgi:hypothetical protein
LVGLRRFGAGSRTLRGGGYGVSDGGREDEHEVQARFLVRQAAYTRRGRGGGTPKGTSWAVSGRGRMRMERAARTRDGTWPRGPVTGLQLAPGLGAWSRESSEVPWSRGVHHGVSGVRTPESADGDAWQDGRDVPGVRARADARVLSFISFSPF